MSVRRWVRPRLDDTGTYVFLLDIGGGRMGAWGMEWKKHGAIFVPDVSTRLWARPSLDDIVTYVLLLDSGDDKSAAERTLTELVERFVGKPYVEWVRHASATDKLQARPLQWSCCDKLGEHYGFGLSLLDTNSELTAWVLFEEENMITDVQYCPFCGRKLPVKSAP